jgi:Ca2+-binding RTX toxin-like protein
MIGLGLALLLAPSALASTATINNGNTVRVTESGNEPNTITVSYTAATDIYTVTDSSSNLGKSGNACNQADSRTVNCPGAGVKTISVDTGSGTDLIIIDRATVPASVETSLDGGPGNDVVAGGRGKDDMKGDTGDDQLDGHEGADDINGGNGTDTASYADRTTPVAVTIGSTNGNDGNELDQSGLVRDTVHGDVEGVVAGNGGSTIIGENSGETLVGGAGADFLLGNGGADFLLGGDGNDSLFGGSGNDRLVGGNGDDRVRGNKGNDVMKGNFGRDHLKAKDGFRDVKINCGPGANGHESATRDGRDPGAKSC